jgi:hypothetical protein
MHIESTVQGINTVPSLPTKEVIEFVQDCDVLFSFASRTGGLDVSKLLRTCLLNQLGDVTSGGDGTLSSNESVYIDCLNLRSRQDTVVEIATNPTTGQEFAKILNPHWAEFYYAAMLFCKTVVVVLDPGWKDSPWCFGEWCLFMKHATTTFQTEEDKQWNTTSKAYDYRLIVIYPHEDGDAQTVRDTMLKQFKFGASIEMLTEATFLPAKIALGERAWMEESDQAKFVEVVRSNIFWVRETMGLGDMGKAEMLDGMCGVYNEFWRERALEVMASRQWWEEDASSGVEYF